MTDHILGTVLGIGQKKVMGLRKLQIVENLGF